MMSCKINITPKTINAYPSETTQLSPEQIQFYKDNGYLVVKKVIPQADLDGYRQRFVDVCEGKLKKKEVSIVKDYGLSNTTSNPEDFINKIQDLLYDEVFSSYAKNPRLLNIVSQLIGDDITAGNGMVINKPPGSAMHAPHQDQFYLPFEPIENILISWTAVDPATKENGCLFVVPGTHKHELLRHNHQATVNMPFYFGVNDWETHAAEHKRVYLEVDPGDTVLLHPVLIHGSLPNLSKVYRKAITCHMMNSNCRFIEFDRPDQKYLASLVEEMCKPRGVDSFRDFWKMKLRSVKGVKSNL